MKTLIAIALAITVGMALAVELRGPSPEELMVQNKAHHLALRAFELYGFPVERPPAIVFNHDASWPLGALADCISWSITVSGRDVQRHLDQVLQRTMPHEYGHMVHCYLHGGHMGLDPHGPDWRRYTAALTGEP